MFMNYKKLYKRLIESRRHRIIEDINNTEIHHIIPKCFGGSNDDSNLIKLTYREHYIAHLLLWKCQTEKRKKCQMAKAFFCMCVMSNDSTNYRKIGRNSRFFEKSKIDANRKSHLSIEERKKYGRNQSKENNGMWNKSHSNETKRLIGEKSIQRKAVKYLQTKEATKARKSTFNKKFGGNTPFADHNTHKKSRNTCLEKYGVEFYTQTEEYKQRRKKLYTSIEYKKSISKGILHTPKGDFYMPKDASIYYCRKDPYTVRDWCINNERKISTLTIRNNPNIFSDKDKNKTFKELGFWYEKF